MCEWYGRNLTAPADVALCYSSQGRLAIPCSPSAPCLYNLTHDSQERLNLAASMPTQVAAMKRRLRAYAARARPPLAIKDDGDYCAACRARGAGHDNLEK